VWWQYRILVAKSFLQKILSGPWPLLSALSIPCSHHQSAPCISHFFDILTQKTLPEFMPLQNPMKSYISILSLFSPLFFWGGGGMKQSNAAAGYS